MDQRETFLTLSDAALALPASDVGDAVEGGAVDTSFSRAATASLKVVVDVEALVTEASLRVFAEELANLAHALMGLTESEGTTGEGVVDGRSRSASLDSLVDTDIAAQSPVGVVSGTSYSTIGRSSAETLRDGSRRAKVGNTTGVGEDTVDGRVGVGRVSRATNTGKIKGTLASCGGSGSNRTSTDTCRDFARARVSSGELDALLDGSGLRKGSAGESEESCDGSEAHCVAKE